MQAAPPFALQVVSHTTPNPRALRLTTNVELVPEGYTEYTHAALPTGVHFIDALLAEPEVESVYLHGGALTLTLAAGTDVAAAAPTLRSRVQALLEVGPEVLDGIQPHPFIMPEVPLAEFFRTRILPATGQDGGAIWLAAATGAEVQVHTAGACTTCPYLPTTLQKGVYEPLQAQLPELQRITLASEA